MTAPLPRISDVVRAVPGCKVCDGMGWVCENDGKPWGGLCCDAGAVAVCEHGACGCGAGDPCPRCNSDPPLSSGFASIIASAASEPGMLVDVVD